MQDYIVVKKLADRFWVYNGKVITPALPRGDLKNEGIFVGDRVKVNLINNGLIIDEVETRKNVLIRPPLANLEQLIIVIAKIPKPDFMIVDKLILFSLSYGIEPVICINKLDLDKDFYNEVFDVYKNVCDVIGISALTGLGMDNLFNIMQNKLSALCGQSAVGKSYIVNKLFSDVNKEVGELSKKIERGKNTTRHSEIHINGNLMLADTAGFTSLDEKLLPVSYFELPYYYKDFIPFIKNCKYKSCSHTRENENICGIKRAVASKMIDMERYNRYCQIYDILFKKWVKTHG